MPIDLRLGAGNPEALKQSMGDDVFPTAADTKLRDQIEAAFLSAHRGWDGNRAGPPIVKNQADANALATIAIILFRKSQS